jgi:hypothetical protein
MEDRKMAFFGDEDGLPDDIDCLFHLLRPVELPQELLQRIMVQAQTPYSYGTTPISQRLQPQIAKGTLEQLVMMPVDGMNGRQLRRKLC